MAKKPNEIAVVLRKELLDMDTVSFVIRQYSNKKNRRWFVWRTDVRDDHSYTYPYHKVATGVLMLGGRFLVLGDSIEQRVTHHLCSNREHEEDNVVFEGEYHLIRHLVKNISL